MLHTTRRRFLYQMGSAALAASLPAFTQGSGKRPNILFIASDDLKPLFRCHGNEYIQTPNIDRLAQRGTSFVNNHCQQAVCGPSRASLLTGLRPDTTQVWDLATRMRDILPDVLTLPQHLTQNGYHTVGMGKIFDGRCCDGWNTQDVPSWSEPFVRINAPLYADKSKSGRKPEPGEKSRMNRPSIECMDVPDNAYDDGLLAEEGSRQLQRLSLGDKPFFLAVGFKKPHLPFTAPQRYWDLYDRDQFKLPPFQEHSKFGPEIAYHNSGELRSGYTDIPDSEPLSIEKQLELIHGYYAAVSYVDTQIGKLLDSLDALRLQENTIVVLWGDHGWHLGDHDLWCKHTNFEQATRSPLLIATPEAKQHGVHCASPTEFVDIFPTLCDLAGLSTPTVLEGRSLVPLLDDPNASVKAAAISQYPRSHDRKPVMGYAYRSKRYRYVEWIQKNFRKNQSEGPIIARELYDYEKDPLETINAIDDPAYKSMVETFEKWAKGGWSEMPREGEV